ncbi:MAG: hypothetical protein HDR55_06810 [Treponema sp.]|nr:hypothetical protein [Treponema sp.]
MDLLVFPIKTNLQYLCLTFRVHIIVELRRRPPARNDEAKIREYEKAIKRFAGGGGRIEDEDTLRRILTVEGALDETTGGMVKSVEEFNEELYCNP